MKREGSTTGEIVNQLITFGYRTIVGFFLLGTCNNYGYVIMLTAAHDILSNDDNGPTPAPSTSNGNRRCNVLSTGAILLADILPSLSIKFTAPFFALAIHFRMVIVILLSGAGFILVAESQNQWVAILGVVFTSLASGLGEASSLAYMPYYKNKSVISAWSSGTGAAGFLGAITYTLFTDVFHMSRYTTLYTLLIVPIIMGLSFWLLIEKPNMQISSQNSNEDDKIEKSQGNVNCESNEHLVENKKSFCEKIYSTPMLWKFMIPFGLVYFFEYLINQGLFELVQFRLDWISYKAQYKWYQVIYQIGVFFSRSSINLFTIKKTWLLALFQGINLIFFTSEAIFGYTPSIFIIFVVVLWEGLLGGAAYVNTFARIVKEVPAENQEFSMAFTSLADAIGISLAGFMSIPLHNAICRMG